MRAAWKSVFQSIFGVNSNSMQLLVYKRHAVNDLCKKGACVAQSASVVGYGRPIAHFTDKIVPEKLDIRRCRLDAATTQRMAKCPRSGHKRALIWTPHVGYCSTK